MKLIGLLFSLVFVSVMLWLAMGRKPVETPAASSPAGPSTLGAPAPADFGTNAKSAKDFTRRQVCLADCAGELRTCRALAADPSGEAACESSKTECDGRCP